MSGVEKLIEQLASATVEEKEAKEVSFAGRTLKLDTEEDAAEIVKAINDCPGMTALRLEGNTIGVAGAKAISKALETQSNFKAALWKDMFTRRTEHEIPQALTFLSNGVMQANARLVVLDLSDNAFGPRGLIGIVKLLESSSCYSLTELHLNNNGLGIAGGGMLTKALCNCLENSRKDGKPLKLKIFVCGRNRLENEGATAIAKFLKNIGTLESVAMPQNGIYHPGIKELAAAFIKNPDLKVINLEDNNLREEGAKHIANCFPALKKLQMINFDDCLIGTKGAISLASSLKNSCPEIREVHLGFNEIGKEGGLALIDAMESKSQLDNIVLSGNKFGDEGCHIIEKKMADMQKSEQLCTISEDEGSGEDDDDYVDEEEEEVDSQDEENNESVDSTGDHHKSHQSPMLKISPKDFLLQTTEDNLIALETSNEDILSCLPQEPSAMDYFELFLKISLVVKPENEKLKTVACKFSDDILGKAFNNFASNNMTEFNNNFLVCLGFLKGEDKKLKNVIDVSGALIVLEHAVRQPYFHSSTKETLQFFLSRPLTYVTACGKTKHMLMQALYQV